MSIKERLKPELIREFVIAGHGDLEKVMQMLAEYPSLLNEGYNWSEEDRETAIQGAAHVGNVAIAEYLLEKGAPLEICTAAMLGRMATVAEMLRADPTLIETRGAHGIPLLTHAALSGEINLMAMLVSNGASEGMSAALLNAVARGNLEMTRWIVEHGDPDLSARNFQQKTPLDLAIDIDHSEIIDVLREYGAA